VVIGAEYDDPAAVLRLDNVAVVEVLAAWELSPVRRTIVVGMRQFQHRNLVRATDDAPATQRPECGQSQAIG
jgi:hypothetical protein